MTNKKMNAKQIRAAKVAEEKEIEMRNAEMVAKEAHAAHVNQLFDERAAAAEAAADEDVTEAEAEALTANGGVIEDVDVEAELAKLDAEAAAAAAAAAVEEVVVEKKERKPMKVRDDYPRDPLVGEKYNFKKSNGVEVEIAEVSKRFVTVKMEDGSLVTAKRGSLYVIAEAAVV